MSEVSQLIRLCEFREKKTMNKTRLVILVPECGKIMLKTSSSYPVYDINNNKRKDYTM